MTLPWLGGVGGAAGVVLYRFSPAVISPDGYQFLGLVISAAIGAAATIAVAWFGYLANRDTRAAVREEEERDERLRELEAKLAALQDPDEPPDSGTGGTP